MANRRPVANGLAMQIADDLIRVIATARAVEAMEYSDVEIHPGRPAQIQSVRSHLDYRIECRGARRRVSLRCRIYRRATIASAT